MLVKELQTGMLLEVSEGLRYFIQPCRDSSLPRLRVAPWPIASLILSNFDNEEQRPIMYLGISENEAKSCKKNLRAVMVDDQVAFLEGRDFSKFSPLNFESS